MATGAPVRSRRRRGPQWPRVLLIILLVVIVLLVAADRIGVVVAEHEIAKQAKAQLASEDVSVGGDPSVSVAGFPFLTQVVTGRYDKIDIVIPNPSSKGIGLDTLDITATGVHAPARTVIAGSGRIEADRVVGTGSLSWASFLELVDLSGLSRFGIDPTALTISGGDDGQITLSAPVTVAGAVITIVARGVISVTDDIVHVKVTDIGPADDPLPASISREVSAIESTLTFDTRIPALPYGLVLDRVHATSAGISITASARGVVLGD